METRANYLMVGGFVLLLGVGLLVFVVWLAKFQFDTEYRRYDIFFRGSVTGLGVGAPVRYSGVRVGEVIFIGLDREHPERVRALIEVEANTPVKTDTVASLEIEGLAGGRYILLSGGTPDAPPLALEAGQKRAVIASRPSQLESILEGAPEIMEGATVLLARASKLLSDRNLANIADTIEHLNRISGTIADNSESIEILLRDGASTMANLNGATARLESMAATLERESGQLVARADSTLASIERLSGTVGAAVEETKDDVKSLVVELRGSARAFTGMSGEIRALVAENREPVKEFTSNGLYELSNLLAEARHLLVGLNRVTTEVERDPARFLFGNQQQGYEAGNVR